MVSNGGKSAVFEGITKVMGEQPTIGEKSKKRNTQKKKHS